MYSNTIKFILTATAFSPILLSYWLVNTAINWKHLSIYLDLKSFFSIYNGILEVINTHYLLILFMLVILTCKIFLEKAINSLTVGNIEVKSIKPADVNFDKILFSYFFPWIKLATSNGLDVILVLGFVGIYLVFTILGKNSYHYNLIFRLVFGYYNYEIQTKKEVTYLLLSKIKIINSSQITKYVRLTDYMIIHITK